MILVTPNVFGVVRERERKRGRVSETKGVEREREGSLWKPGYSRGSLGSLSPHFRVDHSELWHADLTYFITSSFFNLKISMCHKLFITLRWRKCFGLNLGRGGAANQWGMAGILKGDMIDNTGSWVHCGGSVMMRWPSPPTHTAITSLRCKKNMSAELWKLNQEPWACNKTCNKRGHTRDHSDNNPGALIL